MSETQTMSEAAPHVRIRAIGPGHLGQRVQIRGWLANKPGGKPEIAVSKIDDGTHSQTAASPDANNGG